MYAIMVCIEDEFVLKNTQRDRWSTTALGSTESLRKSLRENYWLRLSSIAANHPGFSWFFFGFLIYGLVFGFFGFLRFGGICMCVLNRSRPMCAEQI
eukprot:COSAG06_NODE_485_length_15117_cov_5.922493_4_plen_97_part_00